MTASGLTENAISYMKADLYLLVVAGVIWFLMRRLFTSRMGGKLPRTIGRPFYLHLAWGLVWALAALAIAVAPGLLLGSYSAGQAGWKPFAVAADQIHSNNLGEVWMFFMFQGLFEELVYRAMAVGLLGMLLYWLSGMFAPKAGGGHHGSGPEEIRRWEVVCWTVCGVVTNLVVTLAFAFAHADNPNSSPVALVNIGLAGMALGMLFWQQANPLGCWVMHWVWNAGLATLGLPVSGYLVFSVPPDWAITGARPGLLTGGAFGPEASIPATIGLLAVSAILIWQMLKTEMDQQPEIVTKNLNNGQ